MQTPTVTERIEVRRYVYNVPGTAAVLLWENDDDTWAVDINGKIFEAESAAEALRRLAAALEEH